MATPKESLSYVRASAERDIRLAMEQRAQTRQQLSDKDLRQAADLDPDIASQVRQATEGTSERDQAADAWQKSLAEASKLWEASLDELTRLHPDPNGG